MKLVTSEIMKKTENDSMLKNCIRSIVLMENAARSLVEICKDRIMSSHNITVVCGNGNNGGDGFAVARLIYILGKNVKVLFVGNKDKMTPDCRENFDIAVNIGIEISYDSDILSNADIIIDAIIGTGLKNNLRENYADTVNKINAANKYVIAVDCPTGISSDNGKIMGVCVKADITVTFYLPKCGLYLYPAREYCGKICVGEIGIPHEDDHNIDINMLTLSEVAAFLPKRSANSHKGTFGKADIFAGSRNMPGACRFAAETAYKAGCGLVAVHTVNSVKNIIQSQVPECITIDTAEKNGFLCAESVADITGNVILAGCGIGNCDDTLEFIRKLTEDTQQNIVFDADALNVISRNTNILKNVKNRCVITPHIKEMSRLCGKDTNYISENIIDTAKEFAAEYGVTIVLKSAVTVIASYDGTIYLNTTGNNAMAKGGSGDCLAGIITGLAAQGIDLYNAAVLGCFISGLAGESASEKLSRYSVTARDIISNIPNAFNKIYHFV